jgi:F-type H+-transporting ATPase subunit epsilon
VKIEIITPDSRIYSGDIRSVRVPGKKGSFQVLKDHAPIISTLDHGPVIIEDEQGLVIRYEITGGVIEVKKNRIILLADSVSVSRS